MTCGGAGAALGAGLPGRVATEGAVFALAELGGCRELPHRL